ncbi:hypothetical protein [Paraburkholderia sp. Cpub6]|uniref:hypothetical protein n=1 Tax=Paraburkholderia sp. Cpub6 TaxID=2723094 RepID=UPI00160C1B43|nr:hypothetical protein [Paraburkholderia sp. Cpub6]MBB5463702.1 hypothetical protein [Paraburkholderia sp. Cpub6]
MSDLLEDAHRTRPLWYGALYRETLRCPTRLVTITRTETIDSAPDIAAALSVQATVVHPLAGATDVPAYVLLVSTPDN